MKKTIRAVAGGILGMLAGGLASAADLPFSDGFEGYGVGTVLNGTNGWGATDNTVVVQTNVVWSPLLGTNAAILLPSKVVSNLLVSLPATNVWSDLYLTNSIAMSAGAAGAAAVNTNMTVQWFIETNGYPVVWNRTNAAGAGVWRVCSTDHWGAATASFNTNAWMRFTLCRNYNDGTVALFLDQRLLLQQLPFIDASRTQSALFQLEGGSAVTSYFDEVSARYAPTNFTADLDQDGMTEALEIQNYNGVDVRHRPVITVTQPSNGSIAPSGAFDVLPGSSTSFTFQADAAYAVSQVYTNGQAVGAFTGQGSRAASWTWSGIISDGLSDGSVSAAVVYVACRYVPGDYATVPLAIAAAVPGETIIVSNGTYAGAVVMANGLTLAGTNVVLSGNFTVGAGVTGTVWNASGLVLSNGTTAVNGVLVVSNGTVNLGTVVFGAAGRVEVVNAATVTVNGVVMTGSFTLDANSATTVLAQRPPFSDDFERYPVNTPLLQQGFYGWWASEAGVKVQGTIHTQGTMAVEMPMNAILSNSLAPTVASNVWVEWTYREAGRINESLVNVVESRTNMTVILFVNTNGYVTVYDGEAAGFRILSNDVGGAAVPALAVSDWPRLAVNMNYQTRKVAVLLNGRVLVQQLRFVNVQQANCARLQWDAGTAGSTYLDDLKVWTNATPVASSDTDGDGIRDAVEIDQYGSMLLWPRGSVFKVR